MAIIETFQNIIEKKQLGFTMDEVMTGTHQFVDGKGPEGIHPMEFRATWGPDDLLTWANPVGGSFMANNLKGKVDVGGLVVDADCEGTLELKYFAGQKIRYTFQFKDDEGKQYKYVGEKRDIRPWNLHRTHTTCYGTITELETGEIISTGITYFRFSTSLDFVLSFRLV